SEELRREVKRLKQQLEELSSSTAAVAASRDDLSSSSGINADAITPPEKSGYLFKWQDRSIGWGGTKWGLRFVRLDHGQLSYYKSHEEKNPRYILTLKNCAVRDEGSKVNKRQSGKKFSGASQESSSASKSGLGSRSASFDSAEQQQSEVGSHFHVFSIYQRPTKTTNNNETSQQDEDEDIIPLLRFSTQSYAEKIQWIDLISQSCAYCDSDEFAQQQQQKNREKAQQQHTNLSKRGTLPALVFEQPQLLSRQPSGYNLNRMGKDFRSKSASKDAARSNKISYPPSKPMHRQA
ncbi:hypothetical protein ACHAXR_000460, partial [Thalassiosira sp. AJA248-18]